MKTKSIYGMIHFSDSDSLAIQYERLGADGVILISPDFSDEAMLVKKIKSISGQSDCRLFVWQPYRRLEDIKKILYAGAAEAWIGADESDLIREAAERFGRDRVGMVISEPTQAQTALALAEELQLESVFVPESVVEDTMQELSKTEPENTAQGLSESVTVDATQDLSNKTNENRLVVVAGSDTEAQRQLLEKDTVKAIALIKETENISNINTIKAELENENCTFNRFKSSLPFDSFKVDDRGLIPVIVQDFRTAEVLMMAYMNKEAYDQTLREGVMTYWSRSRQELWRKGDTSGHYQYVKSLDIDCDKDTILAKVEQIGAACHTGNRSCFYTNLASKAYDGRNPMTVFDTVMATITDRKANPKEGSYTNYLFDQGIDKILKKVGEEATEIVIAAKNPDSDELKYEICDFLYHMMVLMAEREVTWKDITKELAERH